MESMSYAELKRLLYVFQSGFGGLLLFLAYRMSASQDFMQQIAVVLMLIIGSGLLLFGLLTYLFKDDPDVWR